MSENPVLAVPLHLTTSELDRLLEGLKGLQLREAESGQFDSRLIQRLNKYKAEISINLEGLS